MLDLEQTLPNLPKEYYTHDKRLKACIELLLGDSSYDEKEVILGKARYDFMLCLGLSRYQTYEFTPLDALEHALYAVTKSREQSRKAICACSLFRIKLRSYLCNCQSQIGRMTKKTA